MNKISTTILETLGYAIQSCALCGFIYLLWFDKQLEITDFLFFLYILCYGVIYRELHLEDKRTEKVKHYDHWVLKLVGILAIVLSLWFAFSSAFGYGISDDLSKYILTTLVLGVYFIVMGILRQSLYCTSQYLSEFEAVSPIGRLFWLFNHL